MPKKKITRKQAEDIRKLLESGVRAVTVAKMFGVSQAQVSNIKKGRTWLPLKTKIGLGGSKALAGQGLLASRLRKLDPEPSVEGTRNAPGPTALHRLPR